MTRHLHLRTPALWAGLAARLALAAIAVPATHAEWFVPFLIAAPGHFSDPWTGFLASGGSAIAFPYGILFLLTFVPATWIGNMAGGSYGAHLGLSASVLAWELVLVWSIARIGGKERGAGAARAYWLSPIAIYVGYWHGQLDIFPTALLILGLAALQMNSWRTSGGLLGTALAAKLSMAVALPFVGLYLIGRNRLRAYAPALLLCGLIAALAFIAPFAVLPGYRTMVLQTPETQEIFSAVVRITPEVSVYLLPIAMLTLFYWAWRIRRLDFEMLWTFAGLAFLALFLLTTASPGWIMWFLPFATLHVARGGVMHRVVFAAFTAAFVALNLLESSGAAIAGGPDLSEPIIGWFAPFEGRAIPVLETLQLSAGIALAIQMSFSGIVRWPFHAASKRPFAIGIGGDSGSGKDTLADALQDVFGEACSSRISGDDYHLWDRQNPMWRAVTHLHPKANDLDTFSRHVLTLADGHDVLVRHYDHASGRSGREIHIPSRDVVLASGLHALWAPQLVSRYDVSVFMDMDDDLRRFVKLRRDVGQRGYPAHKVVDSFARRDPDRQRYIQPQAQGASLVFRLEPRHPSVVADPDRPLDTALLRLVITLDRGMSFDEPARLLIAMCGIFVVEHPLADGRTEVMIDGEIAEDAVAAVARRLVPGMSEFLSVEPKWRSNMTGIMQLVILHELDNVRRKRTLAT